MLKNEILSFLDNPFPLWETSLTKSLIKHELQDLSQIGINLNNYSTEIAYLQQKQNAYEGAILISGKNSENSIYLEYPQFQSLNSFYQDHGLEPEIKSNLGPKEIDKLQNALAVFKLIPETETCISYLVKRIQLLKQVDYEIDTSYSHPKIPFSIFVSLCNDNSIISNIRVAESILHEAMHLKLTLIEKHIDLIRPDSRETFYSPWRDEQRPLRGVLHGLFVFRAIYDLNVQLLNILSQSHVKNFLSDRIYIIKSEFEEIKYFSMSQDLSPEAKRLITRLL